MAPLLEIFAEESVVVNLAVEDEPHALVAAVHWLMSSGGKIDDRETSKAEPAAMLVEDQFSCIVRATMGHLITHAREQRGLNRSLACTILPNSANSAHSFRRGLHGLSVHDPRLSVFRFIFQLSLV